MRPDSLTLTVAASTTLLVGAACSAETTPSVPTNLPNAGAIAEGLQGQLNSLATGSGALSALGQLGEQNGAAEQVKSLAAKLVSDNQALTGKLQQAASAAGVPPRLSIVPPVMPAVAESPASTSSVGVQLVTK